MVKVAILQSNYIPWKGYFDLINTVDKFVIFDDAQFTKNDWRNRNLIKTNNGKSWLTIPVLGRSHFDLKIKDVKVANLLWQKKHWLSFKQFYSKAKYFRYYSEIFENFYLNNVSYSLSEINFYLIKLVNRILEIDTEIYVSSDFDLIAGKSDRLLKICQDLNADVYLSGPAAKDYLDVGFFEKNGVEVEWMNYSGYPEYHQFFPPFEHGVTIIDLLFNEGPNSHKFMKSFQ